MTEPNKYSMNGNLLVEVAAVLFVFATLSYKLDGAAAEGCSLAGRAAWVALDVLRPAIFAGWRAISTYLCEDSTVLQHLPRMVASIWQLLCIVAG
jgi:hypothetical protein